MALVDCQDCGMQHSDAAMACPKCGRPKAVEASEQVVMVDGTSTTVEDANRGHFAQGLFFGLIGMGFFGVLGVILIPFGMLAQGKISVNPMSKGLIVGSLPWVYFWYNF